jgi:hypothetical protein
MPAEKIYQTKHPVSAPVEENQAVNSFLYLLRMRIVDGDFRWIYFCS